MKKLCVFKSADELQILLKNINDNNSTIIFVALSAEAAEAAQKARVHYKTVDDFLNHDEAQKQGWDNFAKSKKLCKDLDAFSVCVDLPVIPSIAAEYFYYYFKFLLDAVSYSAELANKLIHTIKPNEVIFIEPNFLDNDNLRYVNIDFIVPALSLLCKNHLIATKIFTQKKSKKKSISLQSRLLSILRNLRDDANNKIQSILRNKPVIVGASGWSKDTINKLSANGIKVLPYSIKQNHSENKFENHHSVEETISSYWQHANVDFYPLVKNRIHFFLSIFSPDVCNKVDQTKLFLQKVRAKAVVSTAIVTFDRVVLAVSAKQLGLPVIITQHGGGNGYYDAPIIWYYDLYFADIYLCFGRGVKNFFTTKKDRELQHQLNNKPKIRVIGTIENTTFPIKKLIDNENINILYVTSSFSGTRPYFSRQSDSYINQWNIEQQILSTFKEYTEINLTIKIPPLNGDANPILSWVDRNHVPNWTIKRGPLGDILAENVYDLIVCETPATALLEVCESKSPIVTLFDSRYMDLCPKAHKLMQKRMLIARSDKEFITLVAKELSTNCLETRKLCSNNEFLTDYLNPKNIKLFNETVLSELLKIVGNYK